MKRGEFIINGTHSSELNSLIQYRPEMATPLRKVRMRSVPGVDGDYIFDEEAYENTSIPLELFAKGEDENEINYLKELIAYTFDSGDYIEFVPYWDETTVYQVKAINGPNYNPDGSVPLLLNYTVELSAKPFKYFKKSIEIEGNEPFTLINPSFYESEPKITLYGTGDMKLLINAEEYVFKSVDDYIIVDSATENAYKEENGIVISRNHRMYTIDFPKFQPGENTIQTTGSSMRYKVEPRWRKLVS